MFDVRSRTEERKAAFPSPPPPDRAEGKELGDELHSEGQLRGEMPRRGITLVQWEGGPTSQNSKGGIRLEFCSGPSLPPSPCFLPSSDPLFLGRAKLIPRWTWRNCLVGSELVYSICREMATPQLPLGQSQSFTEVFWRLLC